MGDVGAGKKREMRKGGRKEGWTSYLLLLAVFVFCDRFGTNGDTMFRCVKGADNLLPGGSYWLINSHPVDIL